MWAIDHSQLHDAAIVAGNIDSPEEELKISQALILR